MQKMPRDKSRYRDRRSSSYSSESSYERKKSKSSKYKRRSRSRDRSEYSESSSHRRKAKKRSYSRSVSRDRYESSKSRRRSSSRSRSKRDRSPSSSKTRSRRDRSRSSSRSRSRRDRSRSISSVQSKSKYKSKKSKRSRSSSQSSAYESEQIFPTKRIVDDTETKIEKAIKAAEAAGVTLTKMPIYEYKEVEVRPDMCSIHDRNLLADLNSDVFVQKSFTSSRSKKQSQNIVIDLNAETVTVPEAEVKKDDSIINFDELPSEEELREMWVTKLYSYRKKAMKDES